jgi:hypothetical protein
MTLIMVMAIITSKINYIFFVGNAGMCSAFLIMAAFKMLDEFRPEISCFFKLHPRSNVLSRSLDTIKLDIFLYPIIQKLTNLFCM